MGLKTIPHVHLMSTGKFNLITGPAEFTKEDLAAAVEALSDPAVKKPRLKIGHGLKFMGEPCFGIFENMQLENEGDDLYADLVGVPDWLADIMPTAYPNRSVEASRNHTTPSGKQHRLVVHRVALLGTEFPGIETLDDLKNIWENAPAPPGAEEPALPGDVEVVAAYFGGRPVENVIMAVVEVDQIRKAWYADFITQNDRYNWWMKSIHVDPMEVICEDESTGQLYRVPYTASGDGDVTFGDPVPVVIRYEDVTDSTKVAAARAVYATAAESRPTQEDQVDPKELRKLLGLPETATDEELKARQEALARPDVQKLLGENPQPAPTTEPQQPQTPQPTPQPNPQPAPEPAPQPNADAPVQVAASALQQLQRDAQLGRQAREEQISASRDAEVNRAIEQGKIPRSRRDHWRKLIDLDPDGTATTLAALAPNVIPVEEIGYGTGDGEIAAGAGGAEESYPEQWLTPLERRDRDALRAGTFTPPRQMVENQQTMGA